MTAPPPDSPAPDSPDAPDNAPDNAPGAPPQRLAKAIARAGLCSRRDAERWIEAGRVAVNGAVVKSPATNVTRADTVTVDGAPLPEVQATRLWRYHKPDGLVVSARDEQGRPTIFDRLPREMPRVVSIGRLDLTSEGLLLLTNDGDLARRLELPSTGWTRRYRVRVRGIVIPAKLEAIAQGVTVDGVRYGPIRAELERQQGTNAWLSVALTEGKNREIRKVMEHLGYPVSRLIRVSFGAFHLGQMPRGAVEEVPDKVLRDLIGGPTGKSPSKWAKAKAKPGKKPRSRKKTAGRKPEPRPEGRNADRRR
jgi:23S rRNA pseudouridine2605 synthase